MQSRSPRHEARIGRTAGCGTAFPLFIVLPLLFLFVLVARANAQPSPAEPGLRLIGTVLSGEFTGAVLGDAKGEQSFYRLHATLPDGSRLVKVQSRYIVLKRSDGMIYELFLSHDKPTVTQQAVPPAAQVPPPSDMKPATPSENHLPIQQTHRRQRSEEE